MLWYITALKVVGALGFIFILENKICDQKKDHFYDFFD